MQDWDREDPSHCLADIGGLSEAADVGQAVVLDPIL
jgi:hypothetical protein